MADDGGWVVRVMNSNQLKRMREERKPVLSDCHECGHFERNEKIGLVEPISWCVFKEFDRIRKRPIMHYMNIEFLKVCPKVKKRQYRR